MAEILIKNMEMPKGCNECRFHDGSWCCAQPIKNWRDSYYRPPEGEKQPTCPLVEVQTHGDLIDRQKLLEHRFEVYDSNEEVCEDYIETYHVLEAPSIVEASKERKK